MVLGGLTLALSWITLDICCVTLLCVQLLHVTEG